jgi:hypothetical protein
MPRQIIVLETNPADGGFITVNCIFWFAQATPVPQPNFVSQFKTPTAAEATALQDGTVAEEFHTFKYAKTQTRAQIEGALALAYADRKTYRDSQPNVNANYGRSWDGTAWTNPV